MATDSLDWLFGLGQFGIKFGLDNIRAIVAELGDPHRSFRIAHIAGTNGKGSVAAVVDTALRLAGSRTGRFTSPHLIDITERFVVDGRPASRESLVAALDAVRRVTTDLQARDVLAVHPTFFEVTTAAAFVLFREARVNAAVLEVGMGGRLDATNVVVPDACAIVSLSFDHEAYLGQTLDAIAREKAGILKAGVPVVVGPVPPDAARAIAERSEAVGAPLIAAFEGVEHGAPVVTDDGRFQRFRLRTPRRDYGEVRLALMGRHQLDNAVVAVRLLETLGHRGFPVDATHIVEALATVQWPGRLQRVELDDGRVALLDAAHNPAGAEALARHLAGTRRPLVFGAMHDKDVSEMLRLLGSIASEFIVTRAASTRAMDPEAVAAVARRVAPDVPVRIAVEPAAALDDAWSEGADIVVAGSIFLLGDVLKVLGRS